MKPNRSHKARTTAVAMIVFLAAGTLALGGSSTGLLKVVDVEISGDEVSFDIVSTSKAALTATYVVEAVVDDTLVTASGSTVVSDKSVHVTTDFTGTVTSVLDVRVTPLGAIDQPDPY